MQQNENFAKQPEQAEAERPEVVARVVHSNPVVLGQCGPLNANDELMTVAQHAASVARWAEMFNRVEQQRDAALAEVERLREENANLTRACASLDSEKREMEHKWDAIIAMRDAALAEVAGLRSLLNSLLCYVERDIDRMRSDRDKSDNKEIYDRSISLAMERLKAAQNAVFTTEPGCDTAVELAAQTTQAQHSVPDELRAICMLVAETGIKYGRGRHRAVAADECRAVVNAVLNADLSVGRACEYAGCCDKAHPGTSLCIAHHSKKAQEKLLAAAPGKEGNDD
ncbi:TPA: hypothetical protein L4U29_005992 [Pseudomonas aeruginosa]|nr:hypothetical protein [Pseudomonas aeruginosa]